MRPVLHGDLVAAARALLCVPREQRWRVARDLVAQADVADRYRRRLGRVHPGWGNGTLMAAALGRPCAPERRLDDPDYTDCLILALEAVRYWRERRWSRGNAQPSPREAVHYSP
ncbi:hypothetical protein Q4543_11045 [Salipiger sp. 1_MG-2023]|uniref:DUF7742 family protein n=1 Tax=Salipiger sp. 1_MG-2023 TaxID=3062665 RepID=UPI0026E2F7DD|nr:hypothetical protein [Salipiger sp. 1_MG-2023]MDO6586059.1 hypothetical protein [Salipiger sp. 1_MG-2023]